MTMILFSPRYGIITIVSISEASLHGHYPSPDFIESSLGLKRYRKEILL